MCAQEELVAGKKDVQTCKGVEELAKSSLSESEEKYRKAQAEYEKTYARANPPPEPTSVIFISCLLSSSSSIQTTGFTSSYKLQLYMQPKAVSAADGENKTKLKESRSEPRKKKRNASPRRDSRSRCEGTKKIMSVCLCPDCLARMLFTCG